MKRVLMIAYHFPPLEGSSGIQRTLRFVQQLPGQGWHPIVLTAHPRAYESTSDDLMGDIPPDVEVCRAFALDAARHLSAFGRYPARLARPDRWISWRLDAVRQGMRLIRRHRPHVIWSTYPIATAHRIGADLQARTGLPWVADFRDPMTQDGYPSDPLIRQAYSAIEERAVQQAAACVLTTPGAGRLYGHRYPQASSRISVIENGYDEASFSGLPVPKAAAPQEPLVLLHSGAVYPSERDPTALFEALARLRESQHVGPGELKLRFRAAVHDDLLQALAARYGVVDWVETLPPIPYREALAEMTSAGALLILQASNCNEQIPAKLYEYIRARRPLLGLTDPAGDTAGALRSTGGHYLARLDDAAAIAATLRQLIADRNAGTLRLPTEEAVAANSRHARSGLLAALFERVSHEPAVHAGGGRFNPMPIYDPHAPDSHAQP